MVTHTPANLWGHLTAKVARLEFAVGALSLTTLLLAGIISWYLWRGLPVYFVPPGGPGMSRPGQIPDAAATEYASWHLERRYTFTPATMKAVHHDFRASLHPALLVAFDKQVEREAALVKEYQLSSQLTVESVTVQGRDGATVLVALAGKRAVYIGGKLVREEPVASTVTVAPWLGAGRPLGLAVAAMTITPHLSVAGH